MTISETISDGGGSPVSGTSWGCFRRPRAESIGQAAARNRRKALANYWAGSVKAQAQQAADF